ncbi:MAG TPA: PorV/PorQ family protein [Candidatus Goldiibacteriota bacterium]|nr:PorV/PorQ family protein [Candidatus Goldiibacteriota bacterium]
MKRFFLALTVFIAAASAGFAGMEITGTTSVNFLKISPFARAAAMAGAYEGISEGAYGMFYNPAGISHVLAYDLHLSHVSWFQGINYEYIALIFPFPLMESAKIGASYSHMSGGRMNMNTQLQGSDYGYLNSGLNWDSFTIKSFNPYDSSFALAYAMSIKEYLSAGVRLRLNSQNISEASGYNLTADIGMLYKMDINGNLLGFGVTINNLGSELKMENTGAEPPKILHLGVSDRLDVPGGVLTAGAQFNLHVDYDFQYMFGVEYMVFDMLYLRGGYKFGGFNQPTAGCGIKLAGFGIDYAFEGYDELGATHRFSLSYVWGTPPLKLKVKQKVFSPNNDGYKDYVEFENLYQSQEKVLSSAVEIFGNDDEIPVAAVQVEDLTKSVSWYGAGELMLSDGTYRAKSYAVYRQGKSFSNTQEFEIDNTPPAVNMSAEPKLLKPGMQEALIIPSIISMSAIDKNGIDKWQLVVWDIDKKIFYTASGKGAPPDKFRWDGKGNSGEYVNTGQIYYYAMTAWDRLGNKAQTEPQSQVVLLKEIKLTYSSDALFDKNSADVKISAYSALKSMKKVLEKYPDSEILVAGYTDNTDADSIGTSLQRAEAVKFFMSNLIGIEESRIKTEGNGDMSPIADNSTEEGRAKNRRVEVTIKSTIYK